MDSQNITQNNIQELQDISNLIRQDCVKMTTAANSGHPTSCGSCADIVSALFFSNDGMKYFPHDPKNHLNDRFILSKGHAAPVLYSAWFRAGFLKESQIMTLRSINSNIEGHPTPDHPFVDVATGSLGQGLGVACGMAYSSKYFEKIENRYYCLMGDAEIQEGSVWEAALFASKYNLDNLVAIVDCNQFGQSNTLGHDSQTLETYKKKFDAFGFDVQIIDGHNMNEVVNALMNARNCKKPFAIIAKTFKGRNYGPDVENNKSYHGKALGDKAQSALDHLNTLIVNKNASLKPQEPKISQKNSQEKFFTDFPITDYDVKKTYPTREGYGNALKALGDVDKSGTIIGLDADLKNSTFSEKLFHAHGDKFVECFICEQNMVSVASGLAARNKIPFCSTFACFFTRAYDQIRMAGISKLNIKFCGSHCGISIGEDGSSQMGFKLIIGLEDISIFRAVPNSIVLYPADVISTEIAVKLVLGHKGISFIRTSRFSNPIIYQKDSQIQIGKLQVLKKSNQDSMVVVGAGVTVFEALKAYELLLKENIHINVVDIFSVKPIDVEGLKKCAQEAHNKILIVEDHYPQGGVYSAVCEALGDQAIISVHSLAVQEVPKSGKSLELFQKFGISADHIQSKVHSILK